MRIIELEVLLLVEEVSPVPEKKKSSRFKLNKFVVGGILVAAAVILLAVTSLKGNAQYYLTIAELQASPEKWTQNVRISGAVRGDTIKVDQNTGEITFDLVNIPGDMKTIDQMGGIAAVLHQAVIDPTAETLTVHFKGAKPDLLKDEAQAILSGRMQADGTFLAEELLLKCPSKYQEAPLN